MCFAEEKLSRFKRPHSSMRFVQDSKVHQRNNSSLVCSNWEQSIYDLTGMFLHPISE